MRKLKIVGQSELGYPVVSGVFEFSDTHGMPLADLLGLLWEKTMIPCWLSFALSSRRAGWKKETVVSKVREAVTDALGLEFWRNMEMKLQLILDQVYE